MNKNNIKIMKTKHFLMALALPAVFAACTADDFVTGQPENPNLANRTVVGNISFVSPDVANTRLIWDNGLKWTETDKLGAALMDQTNGKSDEDPTKNYTIVDKLYSNYRYDYVNGSFVNGNAQFVEGNYFVYAQYNAEQTRTGLAYSIPTNQEDGTDGRDSWYKNQMWLDHIFVKQGDKNVEVNPIAVFPVVAFKAMYEGTNSGVEIRKVVVTDGNGKFAVNGTVQPSSKSITYDALEKLTSVNFAKGSADGDYQISDNATLADVFNLYKKAIEDYGTKYTTESPITDIVNPNIADFFVATDAEKSSTLTLNYTDPKASVNSVMVVPQSAAHSQNNLKFEIYTNKGIVTISGAADTDMSKQFTLNDKKDYTTVAGEALNQKAFNAIRYNDGFKNAFLTAVTAGQMEKVEIGFKDDAILVPATLTVSDTEELKYYLTNWYAGKKGAIVGDDGNTVTIKVDPASGKTVDVDNEVLAFMANAANPSLKFEGTVTIPAETSVDALDKIVKGTNDLNIVNNAVLAWTDKAHTFTAITNNATLTIGQNDDKSAEDFTGELTNLGTLTLYANVTEIINGSSTSPINNTATLNLNKGTVATLTNHAVVKVNGTVTVTGLTNNNELTVVKGTLTTGASSVNNHAITVSEGAEWTVSGNFDNIGSTDNAEAATIENNGTITVTGGTFKNEATTATNANKVNAKITNNGQIACSGEGSFTNSGDMDANASSITLITTNAENAEVVVADGSAYINVPTNEGKITFIVTEQAALKAIPSSANSLRITATIDLKDLDNTGSGIKYLEFRSDKAMTITCNTEPKKSAFDHVIFNGGSAASPVSFVVKNDLTANKTLEVKENARVTIENKMTFAATDGGDFTNNGSLLIIGTLDFSGIEEKDKNSVNLGTYLFAGGSADTNITWKANA